jgi:hypothetical protein
MKAFSAIAVLVACFCAVALSSVVAERKRSLYRLRNTELLQQDRAAEPVSWAISYDPRTGLFRCTRHPRLLKRGAERTQHDENQY